MNVTYTSTNGRTTIHFILLCLSVQKSLKYFKTKLYKKNYLVYHVELVGKLISKYTQKTFILDKLDVYFHFVLQHGFHFIEFRYGKILQCFDNKSHFYIFNVELGCKMFCMYTHRKVIPYREK